MQDTTQIPEERAAAPPIAADAAAAAAGVRASFDALLAALPTALRATDLQRILGIDKKLSWRVFKVVESEDAAACGVHVPGPTSTKRLLAAARRHGTPEAVLDSVADASTAFEAVVSRHAPDRPSFDAMLSAVSGSTTARMELENKRTAFRAATRIFGTQVRTAFGCNIFWPGSQSETMDWAVVNGRYGSCRLRPEAPIFLARQGRISADPHAQSSFVREPLDPDGALDHGVSLLPAFCSRPMPDVRVRKVAAGTIMADIAGPDVGLTRTLDVVFGDIGKGVLSPFAQSSTDRQMRLNYTTRTPTETLVYDVLVPPGLFGDAGPVPRVYSDRTMLDLDEGRGEIGLLPIPEPVTYLGRGSASLRSRDVPRYRELMDHVLTRLGWDMERLDVYRCRVEYPVMHSVVSMQFGFPSR